MLGLLYPSKCVFCGGTCEKGKGICSECSSKLKRLKNIAPIPLTEGCVSVFAYDGDVRKAVLEYKFRGKVGNARVFAPLMYDQIRAQGFADYDLITCVPTNNKNVFRRGYDHCFLLARFLGKHAGIPYRRVFVKLRPTMPMSGLTPSQRRANILNAIGLREDADVKGKKIIITDDIHTSGATLHECARVLLQNGAESVVCAAFARTEKKERKT